MWSLVQANSARACSVAPGFRQVVRSTKADPFPSARHHPGKLGGERMFPEVRPKHLAAGQVIILVIISG